MGALRNVRCSWFATVKEGRGETGARSPGCPGGPGAPGSPFYRVDYLDSSPWSRGVGLDLDIIRDRDGGCAWLDAASLLLGPLTRPNAV